MAVALEWHKAEASSSASVSEERSSVSVGVDWSALVAEVKSAGELE